MRYVGIDLSKHTFSAAYIDEKGTVVQQNQFTTDDEGVGVFLRTLEPEDEAALEAGCGMYRFYDLLVDRIASVKVINTYKFKVIKSSIKKTDANDAILIARFLRMNELPEVFVVDKEYRIVRELTAFRKKLVNQNTMMRNRINALLQKHGISLERKILDNRKHRARILELDLPEDVLFQITICLRAIALYEESIEHVESKMKAVIKSHEQMYIDVSRLLQIPGIGEISAIIICAEIGGHIERFKTKKEIASYAGLVNRTLQSGQTSRQVTTKRGRPELKTALIHAVLSQVGRYKNPIVEFYLFKKSEKCVGKAAMASARKLLTGIYIMLKYNKDYYYVEKELYYRKLRSLDCSA